VLRISISSWLSTEWILFLLINPKIPVLVMYFKIESAAKAYSYEWISNLKKIVSLVNYRIRCLLDGLLKHPVASMGASTKSTKQHSR